MKYVIMGVNIVLGCLIVYNLYNYIDVVEPLENCSKNKKNILYKQKLKLDNLFSRLNTLNGELSSLKSNINKNKSLSNMNSNLIKSSVGDIKDEKEIKMKELESM